MNSFQIDTTELKYRTYLENVCLFDGHPPGLLNEEVEDDIGEEFGAIVRRQLNLEENWQSIKDSFHVITVAVAFWFKLVKRVAEQKSIHPDV